MTAEAACCESCAAHEKGTHELATLKSIEALLAKLTPPSYSYNNSFMASANGVNVVVPPVAGSRIFVMQYTIIATAPVTAQWGGGGAGGFRTLEGTGLNAGRLSLGANSGASSSAGSWPNCLFALDAGEGLCLNLGGAIEVNGHLSYFVGTPYSLAAS